MGSFASRGVHRTSVTGARGHRRRASLHRGIADSAEAAGINGDVIRAERAGSSQAAATVIADILKRNPRHQVLVREVR